MKKQFFLKQMNLPKQFLLLAIFGLLSFANAGICLADDFSDTPDVDVEVEVDDEDKDDDEEVISSDLYTTLGHLEIPLVTIICEDNEEPTCTAVTAPPGCWGSGIADATKIPARVYVTLKGDTIYDSGEYVKKESGATVKIRGNTSAYKSKKAYKIKLQKKGDMLGRGDKSFNDKNWVLLRTGSCLNTRVGFWVSELIEQDWTPSHRVVNVWMNGTYRGLYILAEAVESNDKCRIKINEEEGYIIEADPYWWTEDISFATNYINPALQYTFKYPDPDDLTDEQFESIKNDILDHELTLKNGKYAEKFDSESFARWLLAWDMLGNTDHSGANMFLVKEDKSSRLKMGPIWDFDHAFKGEGEWSALHYSSIFYYQRLFNATDPTFHDTYCRMWKKYKDSVIPEVLARLDDLKESQEGLDYDLCLNLEMENGIVLEDKSSSPALQGDLEYMSNYISNWFENRQLWLDQNIPFIEDEDDIETGITEIKDAELSYNPALAMEIYDLAGCTLGRFNNEDDAKAALGKGVYIVHQQSSVNKIIF